QGQAGSSCCEAMWSAGVHGPGPRQEGEGQEMSIGEVILRCIEATGLAPREITDRASGEFALALLATLGAGPAVLEDPNCRVLFTEDVVEDDTLPRHAWVFFRGRHYDAECPDGVTDWRDLPVFKRAR